MIKRKVFDGQKQAQSKHIQNKSVVLNSTQVEESNSQQTNQKQAIKSQQAKRSQRSQVSRSSIGVNKSKQIINTNIQDKSRSKNIERDITISQSNEKQAMNSQIKDFSAESYKSGSFQVGFSEKNKKNSMCSQQKKQLDDQEDIQDDDNYDFQVFEINSQIQNQFDNRRFTYDTSAQLQDQLIKNEKQIESKNAVAESIKYIQERKSKIYSQSSNISNENRNLPMTDNQQINITDYNQKSPSYYKTKKVTQDGIQELQLLQNSMIGQKNNQIQEKNEQLTKIEKNFAQKKQDLKRLLIQKEDEKQKISVLQQSLSGQANQIVSEAAETIEDSQSDQSISGSGNHQDAMMFVNNYVFSKTHDPLKIENQQDQFDQFSSMNTTQQFEENEKQLQKYEADIRLHISIEQQLQIYIDSLKQNIEDLEKDKSFFEDQQIYQKKQFEEELILNELNIQKLEKMHEQDLKQKNTEIASLKKMVDEKSKNLKDVQKQFDGQKSQTLNDQQMIFKLQEQVKQLNQENKLLQGQIQKQNQKQIYNSPPSKISNNENQFQKLSNIKSLKKGVGKLYEKQLQKKKKIFYTDEKYYGQSSDLISCEKLKSGSLQTKKQKDDNCIFLSNNQVKLRANNKQIYKQKTDFVMCSCNQYESAKQGIQYQKYNKYYGQKLRFQNIFEHQMHCDTFEFLISFINDLRKSKSQSILQRTQQLFLINKRSFSQSNQPSKAFEKENKSDKKSQMRKASQQPSKQVNKTNFLDSKYQEIIDINRTKPKVNSIIQKQNFQKLLKNESKQELYPKEGNGNNTQFQTVFVNLNHQRSVSDLQFTQKTLQNQKQLLNSKSQLSVESQKDNILSKFKTINPIGQGLAQNVKNQQKNYQIKRVEANMTINQVSEKQKSTYSISQSALGIQLNSQAKIQNNNIKNNAQNKSQQMDKKNQILNKLINESSEGFNDGLSMSNIYYDEKIKNHKTLDQNTQKEDLNQIDQDLSYHYIENNNEAQLSNNAYSNSAFNSINRHENSRGYLQHTKTSSARKLSKALIAPDSEKQQAKRIALKNQKSISSMIGVNDNQKTQNKSFICQQQLQNSAQRVESQNKLQQISASFNYSNSESKHDYTQIGRSIKYQPLKKNQNLQQEKVPIRSVKIINNFLQSISKQQKSLNQSTSQINIIQNQIPNQIHFAENFKNNKSFIEQENINLCDIDGINLKVDQKQDILQNYEGLKNLEMNKKIQNIVINKLHNDQIFELNK